MTEKTITSLLLPGRGRKRRPAHVEKKLDAIMQYMKAYRDEHHYMPSVRDLSSKFGQSTSVIRYYFQLLEEDGRIERPPKGIARSIVIKED